MVFGPAPAADRGSGRPATFSRCIRQRSSGAAGHLLEVRMHVGFGFGMMVAIVLVAALLVPFLLKEIRGGKVETNPRIPTGAGDTHPGRRGNPAPGKPDGQADPYDEAARR